MKICVYLIIPIRQYGSRYFTFFLILGLSDPLSQLLRLLGISPFYVYTAVSLFCVFAIKDNHFYKHVTAGKVFVILAQAIMLWIFDPYWTVLSMLYFQLIISFYIASITVEFWNKNHGVNLFHLVLFLYEVSLIIKVSSAFTMNESRAAVYFVLNILGVFIAVFFVVFREGNAKLVRRRLFSDKDHTHIHHFVVGTRA